MKVANRKRNNSKSKWSAWLPLLFVFMFLTYFLYISLFANDKVVTYQLEDDDSNHLESKRSLRPGGNKGNKGGSSSGGDGSSLYDYNGLYQDHLDYNEEYNEEYINNY